jgi:hypothetical protein
MEIVVADVARIAVLNSMLGADLELSMARQRRLGLIDLDLKECLFGHDLLDTTRRLNPEQYFE